jgi:uncharacterized Zn finger protein
MDVPGGLYLRCPDCGKETIHEVLKGRGSERGNVLKLSALVRCPECNAVRKVEIKEEGDRPVMAVLSDEGVSSRTTILMDPASKVELDDVMMVDGVLGLVTGIEVGTRRRPRAVASEITMLWLKRYDKVKVKLSINTGRRTQSREIWAAPDEEFEIGDVVSAVDMKVLVHSINAGGRRIRRGAVKACAIRRIYGREVE